MNTKTETQLSPQPSALSPSAPPLSPSSTSAPSAPPREKPELCPQSSALSPSAEAPDIHQQLVGLNLSLDQLGHALSERRHIDAGFHFEKARQRFAQIETTLAALKEKFAV